METGLFHFQGSLSCPQKNPSNTSQDMTASNRRKSALFYSIPVNTLKMRGHAMLHNVFCNHVNNHHKSLIDERVTKDADRTKIIFQPMMYFSAAQVVDRWFECIILGLRPFSFCEKRIISSHFKHDRLSRSTLMSYMDKLLLYVEREVFETLLSKFEIVLHGWKGAILTTFPCSRWTLPKNRLDIDNFYSDCLPWKMKIPWMQPSITNWSSTFWASMVNNLLMSFTSSGTTQAPERYLKDVFSLFCRLPQ